MRSLETHLETNGYVVAHTSDIDSVANDWVDVVRKALSTLDNPEVMLVNICQNHESPSSNATLPHEDGEGVLHQ